MGNSERGWGSDAAARFLAGFIGLLLCAQVHAAVTPDKVVVVVNDASAMSVAIGNYYVAKRDIPAANVCHLGAATPATETITREQYDTYIEGPIKAYLQQTGLINTVKYIVTTKGVPLKISEQNTADDNYNDPTTIDRAAVDSELSLLKQTHALVGYEYNPYYGQSVRFDQFNPQPWQPRIILVVRLTAYEMDDDGDGLPDDVKAIIDRAQCPYPWGTFVLDADPTKTGGYGEPNNWLQTAANRLRSAGQTVLHDTTTTFVSGVSGILGYCSWGSNDTNAPPPPYYSPGTPGTWVRGALAFDFVSFNGRTFTYGPSGPSYGQSLVADLIALGATGVQGHVYEPYIAGSAHPEIVFPRYVNEYDLAESFYAGIRYLSWQEVTVGDPLMVISKAKVASETNPLKRPWTLLSIPLQPTNGDPADVFKDLDSPNTLAQRLYRFDTATQMWLTYGSSPNFGSITPGVAYWLWLSADNEPISVTGRLVASPFEISLGKPWTYLGNPYEEEVKWADCTVRNTTTGVTLPVPQAVSANWIQRYVYWFNSQTQILTQLDVTQPESALRPWYGYIVAARLTDQNLVLVVPRPAGGGQTAPASSPTVLDIKRAYLNRSASESQAVPSEGAPVE